MFPYHFQRGGTRDRLRPAHTVTWDRLPPNRDRCSVRSGRSLPPRMQRRLTREPHVTEIGQRRAEPSGESEGLFNSSPRPPPLSRRATDGVCLPFLRRGDKAGGDFLSRHLTLNPKQRDRSKAARIECTFFANSLKEKKRGKKRKTHLVRCSFFSSS